MPYMAKSTSPPFVEGVTAFICFVKEFDSSEVVLAVLSDNYKPNASTARPIKPDYKELLMLP